LGETVQRAWVQGVVDDLYLEKNWYLAELEIA